MALTRSLQNMHRASTRTATRRAGLKHRGREGAAVIIQVRGQGPGEASGVEVLNNEEILKLLTDKINREPKNNPETPLTQSCEEESVSKGTWVGTVHSLSNTLPGLCYLPGLGAGELRSRTDRLPSSR